MAEMVYELKKEPDGKAEYVTAKSEEEALAKYPDYKITKVYTRGEFRRLMRGE